MTLGAKIQIIAVFMFLTWHGFYRSYSPTAISISSEHINVFTIEKMIYQNNQAGWWAAYYFVDYLSFGLFSLGSFINNKNKDYRGFIIGLIVYLFISCIFYLFGLLDSIWFRNAILNYKNEVFLMCASGVCSISYFVLKNKL